MLKVRLRRVGRKNQPSYRVVVVEHTKKPQGSYLEGLGSYEPHRHSLAVKQDRLLYWLDHGAQPSERVAKLLTKQGITHRLIQLPDYSRKPAKPPKKAPAQAAAPVATPAGASPGANAPEEALSEVTEDGSKPSPEEPAAEKGGTEEKTREEVA